MLAALRLFIAAFVVLTVIYVFLSLRQRFRTRARLEREFLEEHGPEVDEARLDAHIREGMREYERSLRRKLILGVYVVPLVVVATLIYVINFM